MRRNLQKKRITPHEQIERTWLVPRVEAGYYKRPRKQLQKATKLFGRMPFMLSRLKKPPKGTSIFLHTHTHSKILFDYPSKNDIWNSARSFTEDKFRTAVISCINARKEEVGRIFLRPTPKTSFILSPLENFQLEMEIEQEKLKRREEIENQLKKIKSPIKKTKAFLKFIKELVYAENQILIKGLKLRIRFQPMPGYRYNKEKRVFEKIK